MASGTGHSPLRRLIEGDDEVAHLLRIAEGAFQRGLDEPRAFRALERRRGHLGFMLGTWLVELVDWLTGRFAGEAPAVEASGPKSVAPLARKN